MEIPPGAEAQRVLPKVKKKKMEKAAKGKGEKLWRRERHRVKNDKNAIREPPEGE